MKGFIKVTSQNKTTEKLQALRSSVESLFDNGQNEWSLADAARKLGIDEGQVLAGLYLLEQDGIVTHRHVLLCPVTFKVITAIYGKAAADLPDTLVCPYHSGADVSHRTGDECLAELRFRRLIVLHPPAADKLHVAPYGIRPVPNEEHHACTYQVHNIESGNNIGAPFTEKQDAFTLAGHLNEEWKSRYRSQDAAWLAEENGMLRAAIIQHRSQKADDRCIEDDDELYAVLGDGIKCDRRVGDKLQMLHNCARFIERRCQGGHWPSYAELEQELELKKSALANAEAVLADLQRNPAGQTSPTVLKRPEDCHHKNFCANFNVARITADGTVEGVVSAYYADINIKCLECVTPFHFVGLPAGLSYRQPMCDPFGIELRAPIKPGPLARPLQRSIFELKPEADLEIETEQ